MSASFHEKIHVALSDLTLQKTIRTSTQRFIEKRRDVVAPEVLPDYQELRTHANQLKQHTLENLDYYLERLESKVQERGGKVLWCADGESATRAVVSIAKEKGIKIAVKAKSMLSEEIGLNEALEKNGLEPVETDLGEFILQLAGERPYHIVAPALHKSRHDVGELFAEKLGMERSDDPPVLTAEARRVLRAKFLQAGMGISGANFVVAESGAVVLVENEGNIRLTTSLPRVHIAIAGIEKLIPRATDLAVFLKLLGRSATGQPLTSYTSFLAGARRPGEISGPEEFYLLLLDNGRTRILADDEKRQTLYCIRCGACSNVCPVYRRVGGHTYPGAYSGPIGAILTPQFHGAGHEPALPFASSLCGACAEVCPVKIDIPRMLLTLRQETKKVTARELPTRVEKLGFRIWSWVMRNPRLFEQLGFLSKAVLPAPSDGQWIKSLPGPLSEWTGHRDFPPPAQQSFRELWRARRRAGANSANAAVRGNVADGNRNERRIGSRTDHA
jgi:L-lactate dehydrogenase complex protein LldF